MTEKLNTIIKSLAAFLLGFSLAASIATTALSYALITDKLSTPKHIANLTSLLEYAQQEAAANAVKAKGR